MVLAFLHPLALPIGPTSGAQEACRDSCRGQARFATCRGFSRCILGLDGITHSFETFDTPEGYVIYFDATGFRRDDFKVWVEADRLLIHASRSGQSLKRSWLLPNDIFHDGVTAKLDESNELSIFLPKVPAQRKVQFQVPIEGEQAPASPSKPTGQHPSTNAAADMVNKPAEDTRVLPGDDVDGTWVDVADDDIAKAKAKGKAPMEGPVLQDTVEQDSMHRFSSD